MEAYSGEVSGFHTVLFPSEGHQASSATPLEDLHDFKDAATVRTRSTGMQTRFAGHPRPTVAPRLLAPLPRKRKTAYYADDSLSESSPDTVGADATCHRTDEAGCQNTTWYEDTSPRSPEGHTRASAFLSPTQDTDTPAGSVALHEDPYESAIDFGFAVPVTSGPATRATGDQGRGKPAEMPQVLFEILGLPV